MYGLLTIYFPLLRGDRRMCKMKIPGVSFSLKRALGITQLKRRFTKATGIPTTKTGVEQKVGRAVIDLIFGKKK